MIHAYAQPKHLSYYANKTWEILNRSAMMDSEIALMGVAIVGMGAILYTF